MKTREEIAKDLELDSNETDLLDRLEGCACTRTRTLNIYLREMWTNVG